MDKKQEKLTITTTEIRTLIDDIFTNTEKNKESFFNKEWHFNEGLQPFTFNYIEINGVKQRITNIQLEVIFANGLTKIDFPYHFLWKKGHFQLTEFEIQKWRLHSYEIDKEKDDDYFSIIYEEIDELLSKNFTKKQGKV
jgi:hypothetical protein